MNNIIKISKILYWIIFASAFVYFCCLLFVFGAMIAVNGITSAGEDCCTAINNWGHIYGLSYYAANILIFCIIEPLSFMIAAMSAIFQNILHNRIIKKIVLLINYGLLLGNLLLANQVLGCLPL